MLLTCVSLSAWLAAQTELSRLLQEHLTQIELVLGEGHTGLAEAREGRYRITLPEKILERGVDASVYVVRHEFCHIIGGDADLEWEKLPLQEQARRHAVVEICVCKLTESAGGVCNRVNGG